MILLLKYVSVLTYGLKPKANRARVRVESRMKMKRVYYLDEVYGISRDVPLNYVERENVDVLFRNNLSRNKHITIFGSSKQGKTCLRKHCLNNDDYILVQCSNKWTLSDLNTNILKRAGYEIEVSTKASTSGKAKIIATFKHLLGIGELSGAGEIENTEESEVNRKRLELDSEDVNDIIAALHEIAFNKIIVLEDFHYLKDETKRDFSIELKAFHENSELCFVVVGVWLDENKLTILNGDLTGRVISINADSWSKNELIQVINSGANLLNVGFNDVFIEELLDRCSDNVYLVQETCHRACREYHVESTQPTHIMIGKSGDADRYIKQIVKEQSGRYNAFIMNYSNGFQETNLEMHRWLLYPVIMSDSEQLTRGLSYREIKNVLLDKHPRGNKLNPGNVTQALKAVVSLQTSKSIQPIIMDYDESNLKLHIVDRGFIIWKQIQDKNDLLELAGLPLA